MRLHSNKELFTDAIRVTAQKMNIPPEFVEKDYWVTFALFSIFTNEIGAETIFKGGTALSKCFSIIERFSEDIDLVVLRRENESANQLKNKLKKVTQVVSENLEEIEVNGITNKLGMIRKIAYNYKKEFKGTFVQVRDVIIVEATWLGRYEPFHRQEISSYIYEMMLDSEQLELAKEFGMLPFEVQVLHVNRTICEKIMSLVRFSYGENPLDNLKNKIRHTYDIHQLLKEDNGGLPRIIVREEGENSAVLASLKAMPLLLRTREFVIRMTFTNYYKFLKSMSFSILLLSTKCFY